MFLAHRSQARTVIGCSRLLLLGERGSGGLLEDLNTGSPGSWGQAALSGPNSGGQPQHSHSETGRFRGCANAYRRLSDFYQAYMMHNVITSRASQIVMQEYYDEGLTTSLAALGNITSIKIFYVMDLT